MAQRPWVTPAEVKNYTEREKVKARSADKLGLDISRAEQYVIHYTRDNFTDALKYPIIPSAVKTAIILIAEVYGNSAIEGKGDYKSETFDDYSYTVADTAAKLESLDLGALLDEYVIQQSRGGITMKLRKL